jgi:hypothetical protein
MAPGLAHAAVLRELAVMCEYDHTLFPISGCHRLSQLQSLDLALAPYGLSDDIDEENASEAHEWSELARDVLELRQLTSLTWSLNVHDVRPQNWVDTLVAGFSQLQNLREVRITGADLRAEQTHRRVPLLPQVLRHLTVLQLQQCWLSPCKLAKVHLGRLKRLSLQRCQLQGHHVEVIAAAVKQSKLLEELEVDGIDPAWSMHSAISLFFNAVSASRV